MSGHNKWSKIKHKKAAQDAKKSATFSKVLAAISLVARADPNPETNPRLRRLIEQARSVNVPASNIDRALSRQQDKELNEFILEAYGPEGVAIIISAITDNANRTGSELKKIIFSHESKPADPGSVLFAFNHLAKEQAFTPKFSQSISPTAKITLEKLVAALDNHPDVQSIIHNAQ